MPLCRWLANPLGTRLGGLGLGMPSPWALQVACLISRKQGCIEELNWPIRGSALFHEVVQEAWGN